TRFSPDFQEELSELMRWRRDVRRFRTDPVAEDVLEACFEAFTSAPSVGLSEPWRVIRVESDAARKASLENYQAANADALAGYDGQKAALYSQLKLSGMQEAPVQLAIFCAEDTPKGAGLGAQTMPEMRRYSVVGAITQFWLAARARGVGVGWVSILDPDRLTRDLNVPEDWLLVGYLCVGWPEEDHETPELERAGWDSRDGALQMERR
ncbi:MAG: 5,6-dimethylbenzimidazole synthase, partial [Pseudomonadota bacterium]